MAEFLFEIGLEEVPARMIAGAEAELRQRIVQMLERERLARKGAASRSFSTPRRLAVWVSEVAGRQQDTSEELMGPAVKIAFKDGQPGPAAVAFAKKAGVAIEALRTVETPKGEYLSALVVKAGRSAVEVIAEQMPKELAAIYWAKNMYWRAGKPERFVRPVRWMLALLDGEVVPVSFAGKTAGNATRGHRVLWGDAPLSIGQPGEYEDTLAGAKVLADVEKRRQRIRKALDQVCRTMPGARWREDHALVDTVTHLTEWPTVLAGSFDTEFLSLPAEVLVTVMRDHQKYFAVEKHAADEAQLDAHFLAVQNTEAEAPAQAVIRHGHERVLRARFNDARFFWEFDQRVKLSERVGLLDKVTFQKDLGSYSAKTKRVVSVAERLAAKLMERGGRVDTQALALAATLAKTDLTTELVKEFTELQGQVAGLYARAQGYTDAVADAMYDQYLPKSMEDSVPRSPEGAVLALADKADTIVGMFALGLEPTGSKDPFALRRAANGIVKILAEAEPALPLTLGDVVDAASADGDLRVKVEVFLAERLEFYLKEAKGQAYDVVKAVLAAGANNVPDAVARAQALTAVRGGEDFAAVSAAFKRMRNILTQAAENGDLTRGDDDVEVSAVPAEAELSARAAELGEKVGGLAERRDYVRALEAIATLRPSVDAFFDQVMVMDPELEVRRRRLRMLQRILRTFSGIADFSEIVTAGLS